MPHFSDPITKKLRPRWHTSECIVRLSHLLSLFIFCCAAHECQFAPAKARGILTVLGVKANGLCNVHARGPKDTHTRSKILPHTTVQFRRPEFWARLGGQRGLYWHTCCRLWSCQKGACFSSKTNTYYRDGNTPLLA